MRTLIAALIAACLIVTAHADTLPIEKYGAPLTWPDPGPGEPRLQISACYKYECILDGGDLTLPLTFVGWGEGREFDDGEDLLDSLQCDPLDCTVDGMVAWLMKEVADGVAPSAPTWIIEGPSRFVDPLDWNWHKRNHPTWKLSPDYSGVLLFCEDLIQCIDCDADPTHVPIEWEDPFPPFHTPGWEVIPPYFGDPPIGTWPSPFPDWEYPDWWPDGEDSSGSDG